MLDINTTARGIDSFWSQKTTRFCDNLQNRKKMFLYNILILLETGEYFSLGASEHQNLKLYGFSTSLSWNSTHFMEWHLQFFLSKRFTQLAHLAWFVPVLICEKP